MCPLWMWLFSNRFDLLSGGFIILGVNWMREVYEVTPEMQVIFLNMCRILFTSVGSPIKFYDALKRLKIESNWVLTERIILENLRM